MLILNFLLSFIPRRLPVGMTEFNAFADRIISLSGQFADRDSMTYAIAAQVVNLKPTEAFIADRYFVKSMIKAASNQVASQVFQDIRNKQQEALKAAEAKSQTNSAEATSDQSQVAESAVE